MPVIEIFDKSQLQNEIEKADDKLVIVQFSAHWCPPCRRIIPLIRQWSDAYIGTIVFMRVDADDCEQLHKEFQIEAVPTFIFFKNKKKLCEVLGANSSALEAKIRQLRTLV